VRVTNMRDVDLSVFDFDFDLTFATLLMNADGTIYHTFAGRDRTGPNAHLTMSALEDVMRRTLREHEAYRRRPSPPKRRPRRTIRDLPWMKGRIDAGKAPDCFHCHMVNDSLTRGAMDAKQFRKEMAFRWPDPEQAGLVLEDQVVVSAVREKSPAGKAGLQPGDRLVRIGDRDVLTFGDVQRTLEGVPHKGGTLEVHWRRGEEEGRGRLTLKKGWRTPMPKVFAWRASKWPLSPKPGFGGRPLDAAQKKSAGVADDRFAFRVGYLVTWGDFPHTGRNAARAGIRKGDLVLSVDGKDDFESMEHFHSWFRLTQKAGRKIPVVIRRGGKEQTLTLPVVD
jgi:hypothetical protein